MKKKEKSLIKFDPDKWGKLSLKDKERMVEKLSLKDREKMLRELDEDRDKWIRIQTNTMLKESESEEKNIRRVFESFSKRLADKKLTVETIDRVFNELITGAYLDRGVVYSMKVDSILDKMEKLQAIRQKADNHLVRMIRAFVDIKRPLIKVFVRKVDQLNVSDKQVNISQKGTNDLDKKNEKIS